MKQSRAMSMIEALANVAVGYGVAVLTQIAVFPLFALSVTLTENLIMGGLFTIVSLLIEARDGAAAGSRPCPSGHRWCFC
ncbi:hypothetical protein L2D01_05920 [Hyphomonadaceae bacterium ML37]|nr:hypothetical protein L2D01_05920 [Hyphomonadaceae bacterium ML37]